MYFTMASNRIISPMICSDVCSNTRLVPMLCSEMGSKGKPCCEIGLNGLLGYRFQWCSDIGSGRLPSCWFKWFVLKSVPMVYTVIGSNWLLWYRFQLVALKSVPMVFSAITVPIDFANIDSMDCSDTISSSGLFWYRVGRLVLCEITVWPTQAS